MSQNLPPFNAFLEKLRPYQKRTVQEALDKILTSNRKTVIAINAPTGSGKTVMGLAIMYGLQEQTDVACGIYVRTRNEMSSFVRDTLKFFGIYPPVVLNKGETCLRVSTADGELIECDKCPHEVTSQEAVILVEKALEKCEIRDDPYVLAEKIAEQNFCPYQTLMYLGIGRIELGKPNLPWIIMTYPYLVNNILRRKGTELAKANSGKNDPRLVAVVDEAHNLDTAVLQTEASLDKQVLDQARKELSTLTQIIETQQENKDIDDLSTAIVDTRYVINVLEEWLNKVLEKDYPPETIIPDYPELDLSVLDSLEKVSRAYFKKHVLKIAQRRQKVKVALRRVYRFVDALEDVTAGLAAPVYAGEDRVEIRYTNPRLRLRQVLEPFNTVILLSGTLYPKQLIELLYGGEDTEVHYIDLSQEVKLGKVETLIITDTSTTYKERNEATYRKYGKILTHLLQNDNSRVTMIVFPSYELMNEILKFTTLPEVEIVKDSKTGTNIGQIVEKARKGQRLLILAVAGGKLTEGIEITDESGRSMIDTIILVGIPYPKITPYLQKTIETLCLEAKKAGLLVDFGYIYRQLAWMKIRQALGRGIRHPEDKCRWVLIDKRYPSFLQQIKEDYGQSPLPPDTPVKIVRLLDIQTRHYKK